MIKLKVKTRFFDKVESIYIEEEKDDKAVIIERDESRAQELIDAEVVEIYEEEPLEEKPKKKGKKAE